MAFAIDRDQTTSVEVVCLSGNNSIGLELADSQMKLGKPNDQVRFDAQLGQ